MTVPGTWPMRNSSVSPMAIQSQQAADSELPIDGATFNALTRHAEEVGLTLARRHQGYVITRGSHSQHFSDLHTAKEILMRLTPAVQAAQGKCTEIDSTSTISNVHSSPSKIEKPK